MVKRTVRDCRAMTCSDHLAACSSVWMSCTCTCVLFEKLFTSA